MKKCFFLLFTFLLLFTFSCNKESEIAKEYTGEEFFRGIFMLEGEVGEKIPSQSAILTEIKKSFKERPDLMKEYQERNNDLVNKVNQLDPAFFNNLKAAILSKNVSDLEYSMSMGNDLIAAIILPRLYQDSETQEKVKKIMTAVNIDNYDISTNEGLEKYLSAVNEKIKDFSTNNLPQDALVGRCVWFVLAAVVWEVMAVVNVAVLINYVGGVNVAVAVNVYNSTNTQTVGSTELLKSQETKSHKFEREKRILEIFNVVSL